MTEFANGAPVGGAPRYPGIPAVVDGSEAIAHVETRISEAACAYPITPSTTMAALYQSAVADGRANLWGTSMVFIEPESEHSSASAAEGFALAGGRVTNFTAGQGLILMKEVLYVISGKRLPAVFHVGARALTSQGLNIHAGHDDLMGVADTGWGMLLARNAQEAADLTAIARRAAEATETPFFVAQDGFLTTHTMEDVQLPEDELLRDFVGDPRERLRNYFEPSEALMTGVVQNQDSYMKGRIGQRAFYAGMTDALEAAMGEWGELTGRRYGLIKAHRTEDAEQILVSMGTMAETSESVVDILRKAGRRVGCVTVTSFRPFPAEALAQAVCHADVVAVVERTDEPAAHDNPLTRELKAALADLAADNHPTPLVISASAGLGSRDIPAGDLAAVFDWAASPAEARERRYAVLGIRHPLALERAAIDVRPAGAYSLRGHSIGGFGSVTTNKLIASLIGELDQVEFVPLYDVAAFAQGNPLLGLVDGGVLFIQASPAEPEAVWGRLPAKARAEILERGIRVFILDTAALAREHAPRPDLTVRMQGVALAGVFLRVAPFAARFGFDRDQLLDAVRDRLTRFFGKRGGAVVDANLAVIAAAYDGLIDVSAAIGGSADALPRIPELTTTEATR